jgi:putative spermidine/putrescine transport system permease protein
MVVTQRPPARQVLLAGWIAVIAMLTVFPLLYLIVTALAGPWPAPRLLPESLSIDRLLKVIVGGSGLGASLALSLLIAFVVAALSTGLGFVTSRHLAYSPRRNVWLLLAYLPFALSPVVLAACLAFFFIKLRLSGTVLGVVLAQTILAYALAVILLVGLWNPHKRGLEDLARTLGATSRQVWLRVLLPSSMPLLRVCFFQTFLMSWVQYGLTFMIGNGRIQTLPLRVYGYAFEADLSYAALAGVLLILPPLLLLWFERRVLFKVQP